MSIDTISLFTPGTSLFHRLSPFTKLVLALSLTLTAFLANSIWIPLITLGMCILFLLTAKVLKKAAKSVFQYAFFMLLVLFIVQSFWYPGESPVWVIGPFEIKVYGFMFASFITLRLLIVITCFYVMLFTTHPGDLVVSLEKHNFSPKFSYIFLATLQSIGELQTRLNVIKEVQQCRGVEVSGTVLQRAKAYLPLMGPLVIGSLLSIESRALALEVRGFSSKKRTHLRSVDELHLESGARMILYLLPLLAFASRWL